jgi:hypothetical protein
MAKTRKPRHTRRHSKKRLTHKRGGFINWPRSSHVRNLHTFTQTYDLEDYNWEPSVIPNYDVIEHRNYLDNFIRCKKSKMFSRFTRRGNCALLRGDYYRISYSLMKPLLEAISQRIRDLIAKAYSTDRINNPTIRDRIHDALMTRKNYLINKAIKDFYVITYDTTEGTHKQSFVDIRSKENENMIPKSTKSDFVFPARYYLKKNERDFLENVYSSEVNNPHLQQEKGTPEVQPENEVDPELPEVLDESFGEWVNS